MNYPTSRPSRRKHLPGNVYGSLTLVERVEGDGEPRAVFRCICGTVKELQLNNVTGGVTVDCANRANHPDPRRKVEVGYGGAHQRVRGRRGSASQHTCRCGNQAGHWAYTHADYDQAADETGKEAGRPYSMNPAFYVPLCRPCHVRWDRARARQSGSVISLAHRALWMATTDEPCP
ncbi:hypothetical protein [Micromonospora humida]|uniref:hypothetical protein n=1 Tax=Micromonospora humida TaxID=2809018 RepID=UPI00341E9FD5